MGKTAKEIKVSGSPKSRKTFWEEEEQRSERIFRALHGNERYEVCDDVASRETVLTVSAQIDSVRRFIFRKYPKTS